MLILDGGVTAPQGYKASGIACGIKKDGQKDLAILCSENTATAVGVFTTNVVKGHSLQLTMKHIKDKKAKAIVINSGNANACIGENGYNNAKEVTKMTSEILNCAQEDVLFNSTGVIGQPLNMDALKIGIPKILTTLSPNGGNEAAKAIMTTDTFSKEVAVEIEISGQKVKIGGMAKGSGMIHPNMATMIGIISTDAAIEPSLLEKAYKKSVNFSFNRISVDGDTSVCDMVVMLANGKANNAVINSEGDDYERFVEALTYVCDTLSKKIAQDGEGATKLIEIIVDGASTQENAFKIATAVAKSPLVKTAMFGEDANWGRIITAAGYSGAEFDPNLIDIYIGNLIVCKDGTAINFDEKEAKKILQQDEIKISIKLNQGEFFDKMLTCDFSYDYVKINGSYRS